MRIRKFAVVAAFGIAGLAACGGGGDNSASTSEPDREKVSDGYRKCFLESSESDRFEPGSSDDVLNECFERELGMTPDEAYDILVPVADLPACEELWVLGAKWDSTKDENYGSECRYGPGEGKRYSAEVHMCYMTKRNGELKIDGRLVVGPDDLYMWRGGRNGMNNPVEDGAEYSEYASEFVVDIAKRNCDAPY